ncbi:MAG: glycosyltransferase, partial [bacterium]
MHILLIHQAFAGLDEAGGTRHIEMARQLASHGHKVTIITGTTSYLTGVKRQPGLGWKLGSQPHVSQPEPGITVVHTWSYAALHKGFLHRLVSFFSFMMSSFLAGLRVRCVDVVWGTSPPIFQAFSAWLLSFLKRRPFLFEVRDLWPDFAVAMG